MIPVLSVENMRQSDAWTCEHITPGRELMARAARAIFEAVDWRAPVTIVCGSGNNAGDGYALALLLHAHGIPCTVFLLKEKFSADGRYYYEQCLSAGVETRLWDGADLTGYATVVDCLLGTGFRGEVRGEVRAAIEAVNRSGAYVVSADINSGLDGDNGLGDCCVHSDLTVSIGGYQPGHFLNRAKDVMREKCNADIGIEPLDRPYQLMERADLLPLFAARQNFSNKGSYGFTALIGGSEHYPGAIRLAAMANAAMRCGAGVVGSKEGQGPLREGFDYISEDATFGESSWEKAESHMLKQCFELSCARAQLSPSQLDMIFAGDLLNQCVSSSFAMKDSQVPYLGLYGACSTMAESLLLASLMIEGGFASQVCALTGSHFCSAERQYRFPLEYGGQRCPTAQWTVTGAGSVILGGAGGGVRVTQVTPGAIVDAGIKDANAMGSAMAPAALDTLKTHFADTQRRCEDYDAIFTGDLGALGHDLLETLLAEAGYPVDARYVDCGVLLYDRENQDVHAGGSGCGCSASVLCAHILPGLLAGRWHRVLFAATGALMSPLTTQQGGSIPGICHAVVLEA